MSYAVKEVFYTLQGEGAQAGRAAVFCRFAGCNLWSGLERDRATARCRFCDTDFRGTDGEGGGHFADAEQLAAAIVACWPRAAALGATPYVVCTGGEPALQLDDVLVAALHARGFEVGVETNGTLALPGGIDWVCVSPKAGAELVVRRGDELKLIYPQPGAEPERYIALDFDHHVLQPLDDAERAVHTEAAAAYCLADPRWRLGIQMHKLVGLP
ncbi:7-cyano-7-deazaguanine reductase [Marichromatium purpuratum 984]|uniref:7-carboxy-7-deazaguanine synthase n=1 Tax=Marichromatium purpuratum 984 TaxID=765910 RepID=W0E6C0_MARPU|nr:7-carboxy-7-deazaguanine synthase [Marichromatium purpuratum]AHF04616.1 7-cyano-7-deazaguanine reductase [Marichromatium purpuratum 984]